MNLDEYKEWLRENGNKEEDKAYEIAREIIEYHLSYNDPDEWEAELHPRQWLKSERDNLEFDLLINLRWKQSTWRGERSYKRLIGVEFKEADFEKVVDQAILRGRYVDYMWIATKNIFAKEFAFLEMLEHGIGWVLWGKEFVKIIIPAKYTRSEMYSCFLLRHLAKKEVERAVKDLVRDADVSQGMKSLFDFV